MCVSTSLTYHVCPYTPPLVMYVPTLLPCHVCPYTPPFVMFVPTLLPLSCVSLHSSLVIYVPTLLPCHVCPYTPPLVVSSDSRALFGLFIMATKKAHIFVLDRVRTNQMPTMTTVYENERAARLAKYENYPVPPQDFSYEIKIETEARRVSDVGIGVCTHVHARI